MSANIDTDTFAPVRKSRKSASAEFFAAERRARREAPAKRPGPLELFTALHGAPVVWTPFNIAVFALMFSALALALVRAVKAVAGLAGP